MADNGRRFSIRNLSFRKSKRRANRPASSIEVTHTQTGSKVNRSTSVRPSSGGGAVATKPKVAPTGPAGNRARPQSTYGRSSRVDWNANTAWNKPLIGRAIQPFTAILRCDLSFDIGDEILILTRTGKQFDWWEGSTNGRTGIFPANFITVLE